jgi:hypothetical protein
MEPIEPTDELIIAFATAETTEQLAENFFKHYRRELEPIAYSYPLNSITYKLIYRNDTIYIQITSPFDSSFIDYYSIHHPHFLD